jgi:iron(III) transport system ATP-binding protein
MRPDPTRTNDPKPAGARVVVRDLSHAYGEASVLRRIGLDVGPGDILALLGPSGCGKTTLLRLLAGLAAPTDGSIEIGGRVVADAARRLLVPPERRAIGMVFQDYALWPHMSVGRNVAFPLEMSGVPAAERGPRVAEALELVGLGAMASRSPGSLSGGQQQRVALARAIVSRPALLLFDEPLSNLDRELREQLVVEIAALVRSLGTTGVYVTHDHAEAFAIADRVAVLSNGRVLQLAAPEELVERPAAAEVAAFLKLGLVASGRSDGRTIRLDGSDAALVPEAGPAPAPGPGQLFVPRAALAIVEPASAPVRATATHTLFRGDGYVAQIRLPGGHSVDLPTVRRLRDGEPVGLAIHWQRTQWHPASSTRST